MKCIRKIVSMVLLLTLILTLAACRPNKQLPGFQDGKKNVVFFVYDNETLYEELATEFESQPGNEDINIIIQKAADSYYEELSTSYVGSQTPDIIFMKTSEIMPFLTTNRILALDEYIEKSELIEWSDLWPINDCYRYNSETGEMGDPDAPLYGLIKDFSPDWTLVYNKELFTTAANAMSDKQMAATILEKLERSANYPEDMTGEDPLDYTLTWSEYYALSLQVKNSCGVNGTILDASPEMQIMQWIQMNGEYLFTEDDKQCKSITGTPGILAAFEMFRKLQDGASSPAGWSNTTAGGPILLNQGKVASTCNGRWAFNEYGWIENLDTFGYMSSPLPDNFNDLPATEYTLTSAIGGSMALCITSKCEYPDEAFKFIEYFYTTFQESQAAEGYNISGNRRIAEQYFLSKDQSDAMYRLNSFYYNLGMNSSTMRYNRYIGTEQIYNIMWLNFKEYFYDSNHDSSDPSNAKWLRCLEQIEQDLNNELRKYYE